MILLITGKILGKYCLIRQNRQLDLDRIFITLYIQINLPCMTQTQNHTDLELQQPKDLVLAVLRQETAEMREIWETINSEMLTSMEFLGNDLQLGWIKRNFMKWYWKYVAYRMVGAARENRSLEEIEEIVAGITSKISNMDIKIPFQMKRAHRSWNLIKNDIQGPIILDYGCGDGALASIISEHNYHIKTADVLDYRLDQALSLPFIPLDQTPSLDLVDNSINTTILWTVLHHCDDPEQVFEEVGRVTSDTIIIVEGFVENRRTRIINCFYDWYSNRPGKNLDVNVPYNYRTVDQWKSIFSNYGWKIERKEYLGKDEPVVPERHILYVLEPQSNG